MTPQRRWQIRNRDCFREYQRKYYERNKERINADRRKKRRGMKNSLKTLKKGRITSHSPERD